jgi:O-antigen/teichoic acid export membrane protein
LLRIYREGTRLVVSVTIPLCLVMVFWGDKILQIFGREFVVGAICLAILAVGQLVNSGTALANTVLLMTGHSRQVMITTVLFGLLLIMATLLLVPLWGLVGAAVAASGCLAAMNLARVVQVWRLFRMQPWEWALMKPIAAGVGAAGVTWPITGVSEGVFFALPAAFLCLMYSGLLFLFGLEPGDKDVFSTIFGRLRLRTWG